MNASQSSTRRVTVNGQERHVHAQNIAELLVELEISAPMVAVEQNRQVIRRAQHAQTPVQEQDIIEIVQFVGGGQ